MVLNLGRQRIGGREFVSAFLRSKVAFRMIGLAGEVAAEPGASPTVGEGL